MGKPKFDIRYFPALPAERNPSQVFTYSAMPENFQATPITLKQLDSWQIEDGSVGVFNLHWDDIVFAGCETKQERVDAIDKLVSLIESLIKRNIYFIWQIHNPVDRDELYLSEKIALREKLSRLVHLVFVHSVYGQKELQSMYPWIADKVIAVPHGNYDGFYECSLSKKEARSKLGLLEDDLVYLSFGQWKSHKNIEEMIQTFIELEKSHSNIKLLLVGQNCQGLGLDSSQHGNIRSFEGYVDVSEVGQYYRASDYFLAGARRSYGSGSLLLALTYGLPIIGQSQGDIREILNQRGNGFLVEDERYDNNTFLEAISLSHSLSKQQYNEMRSSAFETAKQRDWKDMVAPLVEYLLKMGSS